MKQEINKGLSEARNAGLLASSGQYIWFIDSDDSITDDAFQIVAESLNIHSQIYCFDIIRIDENTGERQLESMIPQKRYRSLYNCINSGRYLYHKIQFGMVQRFIFQRSFLLDNKLFFYKGIYFEDLDFLLRAQFFAQSIMPINKIVYNYLVRGNGSIMSCFKQKHLKDKIQLVHNLYCYRDNYALSLKDKSMFDDAAFNQMYWILNKYKSIEEGEMILKTYMPQLKTDGLRCGLYSSSYYLTLGKIYKLIIFILARIK